MVTQETKNYVKGQYGRSPAPIDPKVKRKILGKEKVIRCRPADLLEPVLPHATDDIEPGLAQNEEDVISYCLFPEPALEYFKWRRLPTEERPSPPVELERRKEDAPEDEPQKPAAPAKPLMTEADYKGIEALLDKVKTLKFDEFTVRRRDMSVNFKTGATCIGEAAPEMAAAPTEAPEPEPEPEAASQESEDTGAPDGPTIDAPLNGTLYTSPGPGKPKFVQEGDTVKAGTPVCIVEAMKLFNQIKAPCKCKIVKMLVEHGDTVKKGQPLVVIEEL